jgi:hypothetical protein
MKTVSRRFLFFLSLPVILISAARVGAEKVDPSTHVFPPLKLELVWYDSHRLIPYAYTTMSREVCRIFDELGVEVSWSRGERVDENNSIDRPLARNVVLLPSSSSSWGLDEYVMGVATHREGEKGSVYVFYPEVAGTLSLGGVGTPRCMKITARAIGRIVAHELVHVLAPEHPHTKMGLMSHRLTKRFLIRPEVHLDPVSSKVVKAEVRVLATEMFLASSRLAGPLNSTKVKLPSRIHK